MFQLFPFLLVREGNSRIAILPIYRRYAGGTQKNREGALPRGLNTVGNDANLSIAARGHTSPVGGGCPGGATDVSQSVLFHRGDSTAGGKPCHYHSVKPA